MTECRRMREFSELRVLPWIKKLPSFGLIRSFQNDWNEVEMTRMTVECYLPIVIFILCHSKVIWNDGMRWNGGFFGEGEKKWIPRCLSFRHHSVIQEFKQKISSRLSMEWCLNDWGMTSEWNNQVLSLIETTPDYFIQTPFGSFHCHSVWGMT